MLFRKLCSSPTPRFPLFIQRLIQIWVPFAFYGCCLTQPEFFFCQGENKQAAELFLTSWPQNEWRLGFQGQVRYFGQEGTDLLSPHKGFDFRMFGWGPRECAGRDFRYRIWNDFNQSKCWRSGRDQGWCRFTQGQEWETCTCWFLSYWMSTHPDHELNWNSSRLEQTNCRWNEGAAMAIPLLNSGRIPILLS